MGLCTFLIAPLTALKAGWERLRKRPQSTRPRPLSLPTHQAPRQDLASRFGSTSHYKLSLITTRDNPGSQKSPLPTMQERDVMFPPALHFLLPSKLTLSLSLALPVLE